MHFLRTDQIAPGEIAYVVCVFFADLSVASLRSAEIGTFQN